MSELIISLLSLFWLITNFYLSERLKYKKEIVDPLIHNIFKLFYHKLELNLFKKITNNNFNIIYTNIFQLNKLIKKQKLEFYMDDFFLMYLNNLVNFFKQYSSFEKLTLKNKILLQLYYQRFSYNYLKQLNKSRKMFNLPKRNLDYLRVFHLYYNKTIYCVTLVYYCLRILIYFFITLLVVVTDTYLPIIKEFLK